MHDRARGPSAPATPSTSATDDLEEPVAEENPERTYPVPPQQVWQAVLDVIGRQPRWKVLAQDPAAGTVTFNTGLSFWSWSGQDMTVQVADAGGGRSAVRVGGQIARRGLSTVQAVSWGEKGRIAKKLLQQLDAALGAPAS